MTRWTARFLIILVLMGTLVPVGLAAVATSSPTSCACCRKECARHEMMRDSGPEPGIHSSACYSGHCSHPLIVVNWAELGARSAGHAQPSEVLLPSSAALAGKHIPLAAIAVRGPPALFFA